MNDVFISYSRRDKVFVQKLYDCLTYANRTVWADWDSIPASSDWFAEIKRGIEQTDSVIFVLSPEWIKSNECRKEMNYAMEMGKRLFPILHIPVDPKDVPPELAKINWIYLRDSDDFDKGFETLCSALDTDLEWIKIHTRLQVRALEWDKKNRDHSFVLRGNDLTEGEQFLASGANKNPVPTSLQSEYILASRKDATRRQRQTLAGVTVALAVSVILGVVAFFQRQEAVKQAQISRAGELSAQSIAIQNKNFQVSMLLGVEAYRYLPTVQSYSVLFDNVRAIPQLRTFLNVHTLPVTSVAFSPDGKILASNIEDGSIMLWDISTGQSIESPRTVQTHDILTTLSSVMFSPDGKILASANGDATIFLWDVSRRQPIDSLDTGLNSATTAVAFSPDGKILVTGSMDGTLTFWDTLTYQRIDQLLTGHTTVTGVSFSPNGNVLASGNWDGTVTLWNVSTREPVGDTLQGFHTNVYSVAFSPDGKTLASSGAEGNIILWDVLTGNPIGQPLTNSFIVSSVAFSPDGKTLVSGSYDNTLTLWDVSTGKSIGQPLKGHPNVVSSLAFSPDGKTVATGSWDSTVILWDVSILQTIEQRIMRPNAVTIEVAMKPDGKTLALSGGENAVVVWDVSTGKFISQLLPTPNSTSNAAFSPDGKILATSSDKDIRLWNLSTGMPIGEPLRGHSSAVVSLTFSPNSKIVASGSDDYTIFLWDVSTGKPIGEPIHGKNSLFMNMAFDRDSKILASDIEDNTIFLWDVSAGMRIDQPLMHQKSTVMSLAFSPDGKTLASSEGVSIILWNIQSGKPIGQPLTGHTSPALSLAFSPDGSILASGGADYTIILWDVSTQQSMGQPLTGHVGPYPTFATDLAFSPDGKKLVSDSTQGNEFLLWDVDPQSWVEKICQRVGRNFTSAEWEKYFPNEEYRKTCDRLPPAAEPTSTLAATP